MPPMSLLVPLAPDPDAALARFNPVAKLAAAGIADGRACCCRSTR